MNRRLKPVVSKNVLIGNKIGRLTRLRPLSVTATSAQVHLNPIVVKEFDILFCLFEFLPDGP